MILRSVLTYLLSFMLLAVFLFIPVTEVDAHSVFSDGCQDCHQSNDIHESPGHPYTDCFRCHDTTDFVNFPEYRSIRKVAIASLIGTSIEWYDFFLYGTAAAFPVESAPLKRP